MRLAEKGPIIAPPVLEGWAQGVSLEIQSWPKIISATHWYLHDLTQVDGADFYVGEKELGHIHLDGEMHLSLTRPLRKALTGARLAQPFPWSDSWVQFPITSRGSTKRAIWLFRLAYDRLNGERSSELQRRIRDVQDRGSARPRG